MCSFDIKSLFTIVLLKETIELCVDALYRDEGVPTPGVPEDLLRKLLLTATTEVEFNFHNTLLLSQKLVNVSSTNMQYRSGKSFSAIFYWRKTTNIFANVGLSEDPMATTSVCFKSVFLKLNSTSVVAFNNSFLKRSSGTPGVVTSPSPYSTFTQISIVFFSAVHL